MNILLKNIIISLIFILAGTLFFHNFTSINVDIGRHIKLGEIIWQTKSIPDTNLFSFTAPDYSFVNHHWLSEVIFYKVYSLGSNWVSGLKAIMIFKIIILLATYFLLFLTVRKQNIVVVAFAFLMSVFVFAARTEPRPEIFSYLIFTAYLLVLYRTRISNFKINLLWILPVMQVFWVNMHIYFIIGPIVFSLFLIEKVVLKKLTRQDLLVGLLIVLANLANPNFIAGAIYPLKVLGNYGYNVVENSSLFFLAKYFGRWTPQDKLFSMSLFILAVSFVAQRFNLYIIEVKPQFNWLKTRVFDLLLIAMTATLSFKMQRNIPLFALSLWPVMTDNLAGLTNYELRITNFVKKWLCICIIVILTFSVYLVVSGRFYNWLDSPKMFGLSISSAAQDGTDFIRANNIQGPVFNNFDIGSYLVWQLYPDQKVFVVGRPEAYPGEFFEKI